MSMGNKAVLVIDMQNDYLWEKRKDLFSYNKEELVHSVNNAIKEYYNKGYDIVYIAQVFPNIVTNRWFIGVSIKGTEGARIHKDVEVVSDMYFEKYTFDAYKSKSFQKFVKNKKYSEVILCGLDECGCVAATAKGAIKAGSCVKILEKSTESRFSDAKINRSRKKLTNLGVKYI